MFEQGGNKMQSEDNVRDSLLKIINKMKVLMSEGKMTHLQIPFNDIKEYFLYAFETNDEMKNNIGKVFLELENNLTPENAQACLDYIHLLATTIPIDTKNILQEFYDNNFSQYGEQVYFTSEGFLAKSNGTFVDIGAHHPFRYSNTFWAYSAGWRGVNIEPNEEAINLFEAYRPEDINVCCGVGKEEGSMEYYKFVDPAYNTFDGSQAEVYAKRNIPLIEKKNVAILPLRNILDETGIKDIDIMSIDVEGMEMQVLESNNWDKYLPKYILIEQRVNSVTEIGDTEIHKYLVDKGYKCVCYYKITAIYKLRN